MRSQASLPVGIVASLVTTFGLAPSLATRIASTNPRPPAVRIRSLAQVNQAVPGEFTLATHVESLASLQLAAKQFASSTTNPMRGVAHVDGSQHTPQSIMTTGMPTRVPSSSMTSIP